MKRDRSPSPSRADSMSPPPAKAMCFGLTDSQLEPNSPVLCAGTEPVALTSLVSAPVVDSQETQAGDGGVGTSMPDRQSRWIRSSEFNAWTDKPPVVYSDSESSSDEEDEEQQSLQGKQTYSFAARRAFYQAAKEEAARVAERDNAKLPGVESSSEDEAADEQPQQPQQPGSSMVEDYVPMTPPHPSRALDSGNAVRAKSFGAAPVARSLSDAMAEARSTGIEAVTPLEMYAEVVKRLKEFIVKDRKPRTLYTRNVMCALEQWVATIVDRFAPPALPDSVRANPVVNHALAVKVFDDFYRLCVDYDKRPHMSLKDKTSRTLNALFRDVDGAEADAAKLIYKEQLEHYVNTVIKSLESGIGSKGLMTCSASYLNLSMLEEKAKKQAVFHNDEPLIVGEWYNRKSKTAQFLLSHFGLLSPVQVHLLLLTILSCIFLT